MIAEQNHRCVTTASLAHHPGLNLDLLDWRVGGRISDWGHAPEKSNRGLAVAQRSELS